MQPLISGEHITKSFGLGAEKRKVLDGISGDIIPLPSMRDGRKTRTATSCA